ncbi:hypothetical protein ACFE04_003640 [Oxalis oulophora]
MGKHCGKKKHGREHSADGKVTQGKIGDNSPKTYDNDEEIFIALSQELREEGNMHFQRRDVSGAMERYEKAIKLLPNNHVDVSHLRSNLAACYMQMGLAEFPRAINECNLALEVAPKYSKALIKRARCYEALNRLDLALRDVNTVLNYEPSNLMALEISERVKKTLKEKGLMVNENNVIELPPDYVEPSTKGKDKSRRNKSQKNVREKIEEKKVEDRTEDYVEPPSKGKDKSRRHKSHSREKIEEKTVDDKIKVKKVDTMIDEEKKTEDKVVVEEKIMTETPNKTVKLVFGEDIRWAQLPINCSLLQLREVIQDRFPSSRAVLIKYRDQEGDLVTITNNEELRLAETSTEGSVRLYIVDVNPEQDPFFETIYKNESLNVKYDHATENGYVEKSKEMENGSCHIDDWIIEFAKLFKNHVSFDSDSYLNLHQLGMKAYSEAMEETVTSEEAQDSFNKAAQTFQEMAALAMFNWGNVHMSRARKKLHVGEDSSKESILEQIRIAYDWAQQEYVKAGEKYEEALKIKPDFYEAVLALGQQQFEQAKLSWYYATSSNLDFETLPSTEILHLYNKAEENMDRGMHMWEELELNNTNRFLKSKILQETKLDNLFKDITEDEAAEQVKSMKAVINILWGTILYERSVMEFKLQLPVWKECLEIAVEKFELAGAYPTDITLLIKNHCSNTNVVEDLGFNIDEIIQAWSEMNEAKKLQYGVPSFRLEPLLRRRVSKLCHVLSDKDLYALEET